MNQACQLPIARHAAPSDLPEVVSTIQECYASQTPIYPRGGGTSLGYGLPATRSGLELSLTNCNQIVDYPARDLTITLQAGVTMQTLRETLAAEKQRLPINVPMASQATIGGVVATNRNGLRRYGQGTVRDFVIGIHAVDGRGAMFKGGGRVVKNVAGYDFCKLLTGSLGTLGVITELTLKVRPEPEVGAMVVCRVRTGEEAEGVLAATGRSETTPSAIEVLAGKHWEQTTELGQALGPLGSGEAYLVVELEGTAAEVRWMVLQIQQEWRSCGAQQLFVFDERPAQLLEQLIEFPRAPEAHAVVQASLRPSAVTRFIAQVQQSDPHADVQSHAGNGVVIARLSPEKSGQWSSLIRETLRPAAQQTGGHLVLLSAPSNGPRTREAVWGNGYGAFDLMSRIKREFDPHDLLNSGRFIYL